MGKIFLFNKKSNQEKLGSAASWVKPYILNDAMTIFEYIDQFYNKLTCFR
jgi:hypothetical protein